MDPFLFFIILVCLLFIAIQLWKAIVDKIQTFMHNIKIGIGIQCMRICAVSINECNQLN